MNIAQEIQMRQKLIFWSKSGTCSIVRRKDVSPELRERCQLVDVFGLLICCQGLKTKKFLSIIGGFFGKFAFF